MTSAAAEHERPDPGGLVIVATAEELVPHLRDGDVLLFDKLSPLNRLVQWGDNRPAGHVGVWFDGAVYESTLKPTPGGGTRGGVFRTPYAELMDLVSADARGQVATVRTVTARRHRDICDGSRDVMREYLDELTRGDSGYGFRDAVLLTPFALERSSGRSVETDVELSARVITACAYLARKRSKAPAGRQELFCSQLVYLAYQRAGLAVEILEPLFTRYHSRRHLAPFQSGGGEGPAGPEDPELARLVEGYDAVFEQDVMDPAPEAPGAPGATGATGTATEATGAAGATGAAYDESDLAPLAGLGFGSGSRQEPAPPPARRRAPELGDMVTPGDFWSSPSFDSVAVLHRPAGT
jgi:hypothetical protein